MYRLLIADSDPMDQEVVCSMLDWMSYGFDTTFQAGSYAEVVSLVLDRRPHLVLVNAELEGGKGFQLIRHLRQAGSNAVFCLLSRRNTRDELHRALRCGARECLHMPVQEDALREFVEWTIVEELGGLLPQDSSAAARQDPVLHREYTEFSRITNKILLMVHSEYSGSLSLTSIAAKLSMSGKYIGRVFLRDTGMRFSDYLMAYRMLEARRLIVTTREKISVIAGLVGYSQLNNFYTHFRSYFGISPGTMRSYDPLAELEDAYL